MLCCLVLVAAGALVVAVHSRIAAGSGELEEIAALFNATGGIGEVHLSEQPGSDITLQTPHERRTISQVGFLRPRTLRLETGWSVQNREGVWGIGEQSTLSVVLASRQPRVLRLRCRSMLTPRPQRPQTLGVSLNGTSCGAFAVGRRLSELRVSLSIDAQREGINRLVLSYAFHASHQELGSGHDPVQRAVRFTQIHLEPAGGEPGLLSRLAGALAGSSGVRLDRRGRRIEFRRPGRLVVPLQLPPAARRIGVTLHPDGDLERLDLQCVPLVDLAVFDSGLDGGFEGGDAFSWSSVEQ